MTSAEPADGELTADAIRAAFRDLGDELDDAATVTCRRDGQSETVTLSPTNPRAVPVSFCYDVGPDGVGEVRFDIAGADEPVYELDYVRELTEAAVAGRVAVLEDWLRREVVITNQAGENSRHQVTGLLGALLFHGDWRGRARSRTFEPYRLPL